MLYTTNNYHVNNFFDNCSLINKIYIPNEWKQHVQLSSWDILVNWHISSDILIRITNCNGINKHIIFPFSRIAMFISNR